MGSRLLPSPLGLGLAATALGACTLASPEAADSPPLELRSASLVQPEGRSKASLVEGETRDDASRRSVLELRFSRYLDPRTATRQALCLQPLLDEVGGPENCLEGVLLLPSYDPVEATLRFALGAPDVLDAGTTYTLTVYASDASELGGLRAWDGAPLLRSHRFEFRTTRDDPTPGPPAATSQALFCAPRLCEARCASVPERLRCSESCAEEVACVEACYRTCVRECAPSGTLASCSGCHRAPAPQGLDLSSAAGLRATAFGVPAVQTSSGERAPTGTLSPAHFGQAMPRIDPGRPGNSYLLYKMMAHEGPEASTLAPSASERRLLLGTLVSGSPMPPSPTPPPSSDALRAMSAWIAAGAPVLDCP